MVYVINDVLAFQYQHNGYQEVQGTGLDACPRRSISWDYVYMSAGNNGGYAEGSVAGACFSHDSFRHKKGWVWRRDCDDIFGNIVRKY